MKKFCIEPRKICLYSPTFIKHIDFLSSCFSVSMYVGRHQDVEYSREAVFFGLELQVKTENSTCTDILPDRAQIRQMETKAKTN